MSEPSAPPVSGLVAGKYEVLRVIGRGGMGSVWEGRHATLGTRVAVKFIDAEYADSQEAQARFANEARAAASIQSKHAIHIYDHGLTNDGRPYIVMELLAGEPLDKRLDAVGRIPLAETARIIGQVCRALQRAHDAGIIHRDLKPENIFLVRTPDDDEEIAKVLDFGIAKMRGPSAEAGITSTTKTGAVMGTPFYMSPEQARGLRTIDHRSDLWSLGVIAYRCMTGKLPFDGESVGDLLVKICTAPFPVPSVEAPGVPKSFDSWFVKALEREPSARFSNALDLADALAVAAGISVRRGPTSSQKSMPDATPSPAVAGGVAPTLDGLSPPPGQDQAKAMTSSPFVTSGTPPPASRRAPLVALAVAGVIAGGIGMAAVVKVMRRPVDTSAGVSTMALPATAAVPSAATLAPSAAPVQAAAAAPSSVTIAPIPSIPPAKAILAMPGAQAPPARGSKPGGKPAASSAPAQPLATGPATKPAAKPATDDPGY
jgi:serine/threonine-protein kinase